MSYIGQPPSGLYTTTNAKDTFSGDASATSFTLSQAGTTNNVDVFVENVRQEPTVAYVVDGNTLTFTAPPVSGTDNIYVVNRGPAELSASHPASQALEAYSGTFTTDVSVGGNLTVDTDTLYVNSTNNRVGIGTNSAAYLSKATFAYNPSSDNGPISVSNASFAINGGGAFHLGGKYNTAGDYRPFGSILGLKENSTDGNSAGYLSFRTNGNAADSTERMRIDSDGNVVVKAGKDLRINRPDDATFGAISHGASGTGIVYNDANGDGHHWQLGGSEKARIDSSGNLLVGRTSLTAEEASFGGGVNAAIYTGGNIFPYNSNGTAGRFVRLDGYVDSLYIQWNSGSGDVSGVKLDYGATSFVSSSDERLKENIQPLNIENAYNFIKTVRAATFEWKTDAIDGTQIGFIAQDWEQQYPELISNNELTRVTTDDGDEASKGILYSQTVVVLTAALQEAIAKIETLEEKVAALENA